MEANELRIGTLIKIDGIVVTIDERTIFDFNHDKRVKEPIPIIEEWLFKFGFESLDNKLLFNNGYFDLIFKDNEISLGVEGQLLSLYIDYIHQLQNLYFALTNEELTLK